MKLLIKLVIGFSIILIISISLVVIILVNFDPNNYKDTIAAKVKEQTGRTLNINGDNFINILDVISLVQQIKRGDI